MHKVMLVEYKFPETVYTNCGNASEQSILDFMKRMSKMRIPHSSCLTFMNVKFNNNYGATMVLDEDHGGTMTKHESPRITFIDLTVHQNCTCGKHLCHKNIASGKCTDDFIRRTIGETFFAQYYGKQK